jgi:glucose/arabinose dehydrogenase
MIKGLLLALAVQTVPFDGGTAEVRHLASLEFPWSMCVLPDGKLLVSEKPGRLRIYDNGQLSAPIAGVPKVVYKDQGGLQGIARDPNFASNRLIYLYYVEADPSGRRNPRDPWDKRLGPPSKGDDYLLKGGVVARARLDNMTLRDVRVIWRQTPKKVGRGHFGGRLIFAPDGTLFITSGDRMRFSPAQDRSSNLGKIVRIKTDGTIPQDNPFVGRTDVRPDIWSLGVRNPLGGAIHPRTGKLWVHEMGPWGADELNLALPGRNFGWPVVSNGRHYDGSAIPDPDTNKAFHASQVFWNPVISPSGMIFYKGALFPKWRGNILIGGLSSKSLVRVKLEGNTVRQEERIVLHKRIRDVCEAPDGSILLLTDDKAGELLRLTPGP